MSKKICVIVLAMAVVCGVAVSASAQSNEALMQSKRALMPTVFDTNACAFFLAVGSSGAMEMNVCISDVGRVTDFTWNGNSQLFPFDSTYILCDPNSTYLGYQAFNQVSVAQPNGAGTFPLTVTANSTDGLWQVKHVFSRNTAEVELTDTVSVRRLGAAIGSTSLAQAIDTMLNGDDANDTGISSHDTVAATDTVSLDGLNMMAVTRKTAHTTGVNFWSSNFACNPASGGNPYGPNDAGFNITYNLGSFTALQTKTVKFKWGKQ